MFDPEIYEEIIEELAKESGKHVDIVINEMARHYGIKEKEITELLKTINSPFVDETNRIVGFIDGQPVKRTTYHMACKRIFEKLHSGFSAAQLFETVSDQDTISFITEAMYSYLKEGEYAV